MKQKPLISVIMSVYNSETYLRECIESIINQTFTNFEFIIIDDFSKDFSSKIVKEYAKKDKRIKLIQNKKNIGLTKSLNKALSLAKGEYIARIDADDVSMKDRLEIQVEFLNKNKDVFLIGSNALLIDSAGAEINKTKLPLLDIKNKLLKNNCIFHPSIMFRNDGSRYREKFYYAQDYDFYLQSILAGKKLLNLPGYLIKYRKNQESISSTKKAKQKAFAEYAKEFFKLGKKDGEKSYFLFDQNIILKSDLSLSYDPILLISASKAALHLKNYSQAIIIYYRYIVLLLKRLIISP